MDISIHISTLSKKIKVNYVFISNIVGAQKTCGAKVHDLDVPMNPVHLKPVATACLSALRRPSVANFVGL